MRLHRVVFVLALLVAGPVQAQSGSVARPPQSPIYRVEELAKGLKAPWSLVFLPGDSLLITEKHGALRLWRQGTLAPEPVTGGPANVLQKADAGLLDLALDPSFAQNRLVYLTFSQGTDSANGTALYRARFDGGRLTDGRVIFRASPDKKGPAHPGSRLTFLPDQTLLMTIGEGYDYRTQAQSLSTDLGKIIRLNRDGTIPADNPFRSDPTARHEIYSYGHRNPQGLLLDPRDSSVWAHEHGPKGGDEINLIRAGKNYGWPAATYGIDYDGTIISQLREAPGIEGPKVIWIPSIAPSGFALYLGDKFPEWRGDFFVGALAHKHLRRVRLKDGEAVLQEVLLKELNSRIRDVRAGPDGLLYVLIDHATDGKLLRLLPN